MFLCDFVTEFIDDCVYLRDNSSYLNDKQQNYANKLCLNVLSAHYKHTDLNFSVRNCDNIANVAKTILIVSRCLI